MNQFIQKELRGQFENGSENRLDMDSFVEIVRDVLKMKKNLCIARQLNTLKKEQLKLKTSPIFIDVWPVMNFYF